MATSRTGRADWKNVSAKVLKDFHEQGRTRCPYCDIEMDFENRRASNGAHVDHKIADAKGGSSDYHNLQLCCFKCNSSKGDRDAPKTRTVLARKPLRVSRKW